MKLISGLEVCRDRLIRRANVQQCHVTSTLRLSDKVYLLMTLDCLDFTLRTSYTLINES